MAGVPEIVGALFAAVTVIEKAGRLADSEPSEAVMTMAANVPALAAAGVPESRPVDVLKLAHDGLFEMLNVSAWPSGSDAVGVNE